MKNIYILLIFFGCSAIIISIFLTCVYEGLEQQKNWEAENMNVSLAGRISEKKLVSKVGRNAYLVCVDLHYSSVSDFFVNNKKHYLFLKIKNNKATFFLPTLPPNIDSVAINMNGQKLEQYYYKGKMVAQHYPASFDGGYADEDDLKFCE